jgi:dTDP-3-amino-3,4,6-trideoxy-alpha-D-glucose transaminase
VFSFAPLKPLGAPGNGGAIVTDNHDIARRARLFRGYGSSEAPAEKPGFLRVTVEGYHLPLDPFQAAILRVKLTYLEAWTRARQRIAKAYASALETLPITLPSFRKDSAPTFRTYTVRVRNRDDVYQRLRDLGVEVVLHYVPPMHLQPVYTPRYLPGSKNLPATEQLAGDLIGLPVSPELTEDDVAVVIEAMKRLLGSAP